MFATISPKKIGWEPYVYLVYLVFLVFQPLFNPERSWRDFAFIALLLAAFLPIYFWGFQQQGPKLYLAVSLIVLLGFLGLFVNSGASVFFVYAMAASAQGLPGPAWRFMALIFVVMLLSAWLSPIPFPQRLWVYGPAFILVPAIGVVTIFETEKERANLKLQIAQSEIEHLATIAERERIARDLHDVLGHTLSMIALKAELASRLLEQNPPRAKQEISDVARISREALSEVRSAVTGYRSKGLTAEVARAKLALESAGVSFTYQNDTQALTALQESGLSLVIREAVTNIVRHARATRCVIVLSEDSREIKLEISDNGQGLKNHEGSGLAGMRERVEALGGKFRLESEGGVHLRVSLPRQAELAESLKELS